GVAYTMLDNKFPLILALQAAVCVGRFQLFATLLSKVTSDSAVQVIDSATGETLLHVVANSTISLYTWGPTLADKLQARGVNAGVVDKRGNKALHYAARRVHRELLMHLLSKEKDKKAAVNEANKEG